MASNGSSGANRAPNSLPTPPQPGSDVLPRPASRRTLSGSEDDPNGVSLLTIADEEVADLIRTYLPKIESTEEVVNAYKMKMSKELLRNLSIAVKAYLHEFLISRGHTFPPHTYVSNALESLLEE